MYADSSDSLHYKYRAGIAEYKNAWHNFINLLTTSVRAQFSRNLFSKRVFPLGGKKNKFAVFADPRARYPAKENRIEIREYT